MGVTVELTYDMGKALGVRTIEVGDVATVADVLKATEARFTEEGQDYRQLTRVAAIAVNGQLMNYRKGRKTKLADGDRVAFVKAAAGG
jgi:molybdopterin converting factor small subunit